MQLYRGVKDTVCFCPANGNYASTRLTPGCLYELIISDDEKETRYGVQPVYVGRASDEDILHCQGIDAEYESIRDTRKAEKQVKNFMLDISLKEAHDMIMKQRSSNYERAVYLEKAIVNYLTGIPPLR